MVVCIATHHCPRTREPIQSARDIGNITRKHVQGVSHLLEDGPLASNLICLPLYSVLLSAEIFQQANAISIMIGYTNSTWDPNSLDSSRYVWSRTRRASSADLIPSAYCAYDSGQLATEDAK